MRHSNQTDWKVASGRVYAFAPLTSTATYKQDGEELTGTHVGQYGELALKGTVKGNAITYQVTIELEGNQLTITYSGKVDGDNIIGTADFGGMASGNWTAKRKKS